MQSSFTPKLALYLVSPKRASERGYSLVVAIGTILLLSTLLAAYSVISQFEGLSSRSSQVSNEGFFIAEAGLNLRAEQVRAAFDNFETPSGIPENLAPGDLPCENNIGGTEDYECITFDFENSSARTGLSFLGATNITIEPGEPFQFLNAQELRYVASSTAFRNDDVDSPQAILGMNFLNRRIPIFQFMVFYDKDLEIVPGSNMTLDGPIHSNANVFLNNQGGTLRISDRLSLGQFPDGTSGELFRRRKEQNFCTNNSVIIEDNDGNDLRPICNTDRTDLPTELVSQERVQFDLPALQVPDIEDFSVDANATYWRLADLRIVLDLFTNEIQVRNANLSRNGTLTTILNNSCVGATYRDLDPNDPDGARFYNTREGSFVEMLNIDMDRLLTCLDNNSASFGFELDDTSQDGLVFYFSVIGPDSDNLNNYGVRLTEGSSLRGDAADVEGLTVVTDQASYIQGDYNSVDAEWVPAAVISDSLNILSNDWLDTRCQGFGNANCSFANRRVTQNTEINSAFLSGTSGTNGAAGEGLLNQNPYQGGMHNYPRLHEIWTRFGSFGAAQDNELIISGSFVSLNEPDHVDGVWLIGRPWQPHWYYQQAVRTWSFENRFRNPDLLPPLTPQVNLLQQELFVRDFTR
ncbi:MAG: hypothetical protein AAGC93_28230 [Cyanobacteria bacterium P01_F01_bin.53]